MRLCGNKHPLAATSNFVAIFVGIAVLDGALTNSCSRYHDGKGTTCEKDTGFQVARIIVAAILLLVLFIGIGASWKWNTLQGDNIARFISLLASIGAILAASDVIIDAGGNLNDDNKADVYDTHIVFTVLESVVVLVALCAGLGCDSAEDAVEVLTPLQMWPRPHRHFHDIPHVKVRFAGSVDSNIVSVTVLKQNRNQSWSPVPGGVAPEDWTKKNTRAVFRPTRPFAEGRYKTEIRYGGDLKFTWMWRMRLLEDEATSASYSDSTSVSTDGPQDEIA